MSSLEGGERQTIVYIDLLFLENLLLDMYVLLFTGILLRQSTTCFRIVSAASLGSLCSCLWTWMMLNTSIISKSNLFCLLLYAMLLYGILPALMLYITFGCISKKKLYENLLTFYGIAFFTGGMMSSFYHHLNLEKNNRNMLSAWLLIVFSLFAAMGILVAVCRNLYLNSVKIHTIYKMRLEHKGQSVTFNVLLDTGNSLYEPKTGKPVCIVESRVFDVLNCEEHLLQCLDDQECEWPKTWISFQSVGVQNGTLPVYCIEQMIIGQGTNVWTHRHAYVGCYEGIFSQRGDYQGILHPEMLK